MAGRSPWAFFSEPAGDANFNGGLNSAGGNLSLQDNESSGLQNVDFNFLGSVLQRNGYTVLNTIPLGTANFMEDSSGNIAQDSSGNMAKNSS